MKTIPFFLLLACGVQGQTIPSVTLEIEVENVVPYFRDTPDYSKYATDPAMTSNAASRNFGGGFLVGDIVSVNGKPAKGVWVSRAELIFMNPTPTPGQMIADVTRTGTLEWIHEILQPDGTPVGTFMATGLNGGPPPPGAPITESPGQTNMTIVGGTGAFLGARGQAKVNRSTPYPGANAGGSFTEDPITRRTNRRTSRRHVVHLIPLAVPQVTGVYHGGDFSPVTPTNPARKGELLIVSASGLGPTRPGVNPGQTFPAAPLQEVNSPLDVTVNGKDAVVVNKVGWPGMIDGHRVDFTVPDGVAAGMATLQLTSAWIAGGELKIPVQ